MRIDVSVKDIVNLYYYSGSDWRRDAFVPRSCEAIVLFTSGRIEYTFGDELLTAGEGDLLLLPRDIPYSGRLKSSSVSFFVLDFSCTSASDFTTLGAPCAVTVGDYQGVSRAFSDALVAWREYRTNINLEIKAFLYSILATIGMDKSAVRHLGQNNEIIAYIAENFRDPRISVRSLCHRFFISESQLRRNVIKMTGLSPNDYINTLRINKAKSELSYTAKSVKEISEECGFASPYYFSRCFLKFTGISPSKYRTLSCI